MPSTHCVMALALVVKTISNATFHPLDVMLLMSGWYFVVILARVHVANISLQYVNSINCIVIFGVGLQVKKGGGVCTSGL